MNRIIEILDWKIIPPRRKQQFTTVYSTKEEYSTSKNTISLAPGICSAGCRT
jgi:hypothetical protein